MECLICGKEYEGYASFSAHIRHNPKIDLKLYYLNYLGNEIKYCLCGKECKFWGLSIGFGKSCCSKECKSKVKSDVNKKVLY